MTNRQVNTYTEEFRRSSAQLAVDSDQPVSKTENELGINVTTPHGWIHKYANKPTPITKKLIPPKKK